MKLGALASAAGLEAGEASDAEVTGFAIDHRKVAPGNVFGAFEGTVVNGEDFIPAGPRPTSKARRTLPTRCRAVRSHALPRSISSRPRARSSP